MSTLARGHPVYGMAKAAVRQRAFDERSIPAYTLSGMSSNKKPLSVRSTVPRPATPHACDWSDAERRLQSVYPTLIGGLPASQIIADGRGER